MQSNIAVLSFLSTAAHIGYTPDAAYVARQRRIFPVRVRQIGGKLVCFAADIQEYLRTGNSQAHLSVPALKKVVTVRAGRPTKRETLEAVRNGLSVRELRAQTHQTQIAGC